MVGESSPPTSAIRRVILWHRRCSKKLPETLKTLQAEWALGAPVRLMFQDGARFGRINDVRHAWALEPIRPVCTAMLTREYTYAFAAVDVDTGELDTLILLSVNGECMQVFLDEVSTRHPVDHIVMVLDGAGWHSSQALNVPKNIKMLPLPPYAPKLNPVEHLWDELREEYVQNLAFDSLDALQDQLLASLRAMETDHLTVQSIVRWPCIVEALFI